MCPPHRRQGLYTRDRVAAIRDSISPVHWRRVRVSEPRRGHDGRGPRSRHRRLGARLRRALAAGDDGGRHGRRHHLGRLPAPRAGRHRRPRGRPRAGRHGRRSAPTRSPRRSRRRRASPGSSATAAPGRRGRWVPGNASAGVTTVSHARCGPNRPAATSTARGASVSNTQRRASQREVPTWPPPRRPSLGMRADPPAEGVARSTAVAVHVDHADPAEIEGHANLARPVAGGAVKSAVQSAVASYAGRRATIRHFASLRRPRTIGAYVK